MGNMPAKKLNSKGEIPNGFFRPENKTLNPKHSTQAKR
jgi:hypothetical protein